MNSKICSDGIDILRLLCYNMGTSLVAIKKPSPAGEGGPRSGG